MEIWVWIIIGFIAGLVVYAVLNMIFAKDPSEELEKLADERAAELAKAEMKTAVLQDKLIQAETARDEQREVSEAECRQKLAEAEADHQQALQQAAAECSERIAATEAAHREKLAQIEKQFASLQEAFTRQAAEVGATLAAAGLVTRRGPQDEALEALPAAPQPAAEEGDPAAIEAALMASTGASMSAGEEVLEPTAKAEDDFVPEHETLEPEGMELDLDLPDPVPELEFAGEELLEPLPDEPALDDDRPDAALVAGAAAAASAMFAGFDEDAEVEATAEAEEDVLAPAPEEPIETGSEETMDVAAGPENENEGHMAAAAAAATAAAAAHLIAGDGEEDAAGDDPEAEAELAAALSADELPVEEPADDAKAAESADMELEEALAADPDLQAGTPDIMLDPTAMLVAAGGHDDTAFADELSAIDEAAAEQAAEGPEAEQPEAETLDEALVDDAAAMPVPEIITEPAEESPDQETISREEAEYLDEEEALLAGAPVEDVATESAEEGDEAWREDTSVWTGEFFNNMKLDGDPVLVREDEVIDFDWGMGSPAPEVNADQFSARWTRTAVLPPGLYRFTLTSDDGARLWVNDRLVISAWYDHTQMTFRREIELPGGPVDLRLEYYENSMAALVRVSWERIG